MIIFRSNLEKSLLAYFFLNPQKEHHLNELARILSLNPANLDKKIKELKKFGLFKLRKQGNQSIYSLNKSFFLYHEYESIIRKVAGPDHLILNALKKIPGLSRAYLFGSYVNGKMDEFSDIDLLVIGHQDSLSISKALTDLEKKIGREINVVEMSPEDFSKKKDTDPFLKHVFKQKITLLLP